MKILFVLLLTFVLSFTAVAKDECHEMPQESFVTNLPKAVAYFVKANRFPIGKVVISAGQTCGNEDYFEFEAKPEVNNVGNHWSVVLDSKTGKMSILDGI